MTDRQKKFRKIYFSSEEFKFVNFIVNFDDRQAKKIRKIYFSSEEFKFVNFIVNFEVDKR